MNDYYIIERQTGVHKWFDISTISNNNNEPKELADNADKIMPCWAAKNPQIRTVLVRIQEIEN